LPVPLFYDRLGEEEEKNKSRKADVPTEYTKNTEEKKKKKW
jgi:hypothetical protein